MEERVTTSFIPKASLETPGFKVPRANPAALANIVAGALLVIAIAAAAGVFIFERYTENAITTKQDSLAKSREAFEPATIKELARLDTRITTAESLLSGHVAVSDLFDELERLTLSSVRYSNFDYSTVAPGHVILTMSGEAGSYNAIALQSDTFSKSDIITDPIFSNVNVNRNGLIMFDFTAVVDTTRMQYAPTSQSAQPVVVPQTGSTTPQ